MKDIHDLSKLNDIEINYILSRNRSGSTLLSNLLNNHPNLLCIPELNIYWHLRKSYKNIIHFDNKTILKFIDDLFFIYKKQGHRYTKFMLPSKEELIDILNQYNNTLDFSSICKIINLHTTTNYNHNKTNIKSIIKKEINLNHLFKKIYNNNPKTKFIILVRNHRANIYSSLKFNSARKNYIYEAKRYALELSPLIDPSIPEDKKLIIKYKELINETDNCLKKIQLFLDIDIINNLSLKNNPLPHKLLMDKAKEYGLPQKELSYFIKYHYGSFSKIDKTKIKEWKYKEAFDKVQLKKIDYICKDVAIPLGFKCSTKHVSFSLSDRYYIMMAIIDYHVLKYYSSLTISLKRILEKLNFFNLYEHKPY